MSIKEDGDNVIAINLKSPHSERGFISLNYSFSPLNTLILQLMTIVSNCGYAFH